MPPNRLDIHAGMPIIAKLEGYIVWLEEQAGTGTKENDVRKDFLYAALAVVALASGCASTKQFVAFPDQTKTVENANQGRIYVMRPSNFGSFASAVTFSVSDSGRLIGKTGPSGFLCWEREPGTAQVMAEAEKDVKLEVAVQAGKVVYIRQKAKIGWWTARTSLTLVDEAEGKKILNGCDPPKLVKE